MCKMRPTILGRILSVLNVERVMALNSHFKIILIIFRKSDYHSNKLIILL